MVDKGLSRFIPGEVHEAHRPVAASTWELAALSYVVAIWLSVIGSLVLGFSISFHAGLGRRSSVVRYCSWRPPSAWSP